MDEQNQETDENYKLIGEITLSPDFLGMLSINEHENLVITGKNNENEIGEGKTNNWNTWPSDVRGRQTYLQTDDCMR